MPRLDDFSARPAAELRAQLIACADVPGLADALMAGRPFSTAAAAAGGQRGLRGALRPVFLVRAAGRDAVAVLAELVRRLGNDDAARRAARP